MVMAVYGQLHTAAWGRGHCHRAALPPRAFLSLAQDEAEGRDALPRAAEIGMI